MKALITGASSGIGRDIAHYLETLGYDLFVVARDKRKLDKIYQKSKTKVTTIALDLTNSDNCIKLHNMLKQEKIDILVNNAGFGDSGNFSETPLDKELNMIDLNIKAYHILTKLFLIDFIKQDYGRILNIASMASFMPGPYMACYYATKAYILNLSLAIAEELKKDNSHVKISIFCPGPVTTNFNHVANVTFHVPSITSDYAAKYAIDHMFQDQLIIVPTNMKLNHILAKLGPTKLVLAINSHIQERVSHEKTPPKR